MNEGKQAEALRSFAKAALRGMVVGKMPCNLMSNEPLASLQYQMRDNSRATNQSETVPRELRFDWTG